VISRAVPVRPTPRPDESRIFERREEFAGGEGIESAEASGEFGSGQALLAVEPAEKIGRAAPALGRLTQLALGDAIVSATRPTKLKITGRSR